MRQLRKFVLMVAAALGLVVLLSGAALGVSITVWHSMTTTQQDLLEEITEDFRRVYPDIEVELVYAGGYVDTMEKALTAHAAGAGPHVLQLEQTRSAVFYYSGALLSIDEFIDGPDGIDLSDFSPTMLGAVTYDGKLYGLPYNVSTPLLYYNRGLFLESGLSGDAPRTTQELFEFARKITRDTDGDGNPDIYGFDFYEWGWLFEAWIGRRGGRVLNDDLTAFTFNSQEAVEIMEFAQEMVNQHQVARAPGNYSQFWNGTLAMRELSTASLANNIRSAAEHGMDMAVAPLVCDVECYAPIGGGNFFLMNTGTREQQEAAWKYLRFITNTENLARFSAGSGYMAGRRSAFEHPILLEKFLEQPEFRVTYEQMDTAYPRPKVPFWQSDVAPLLTGFFRVQFAENGNVRQYLDQAVEKANQRLMEWRSELGL